MFNLFKPFDMLTIKSSGIVAYNPLINYDWSTTTTSGLRYLKDVGSTPTYNASMYFGRGAYFNGVDQDINTKVGAGSSGSVLMCLSTYSTSGYLFCNSTAGSRCYITITSGTLSIGLADSNLSSTYSNTNMIINDGLMRNIALTWGNNTFNVFINGIKIYTGNYSGVVNTSPISIGANPYPDTRPTFTTKDVYMFNRVLSQSEITQSYEQPEAFYAMAQADSTCVLNMPMCETSSTARNYKTGIDYPITNYTSSVRDNAKNLRYGLQTCKFVRDSLGVIQSASDYLECNGTGYATIPSHTDTVNIKMTVNPTSLSGNLLSGGATKTLTGLTLNVDNDVVISNVTPTGAITLASGFTGTIKSYKEELV